MRVKSTHRAFIISAIVDILKTLDSKSGSNGYTTVLNNNVLPNLVLWDQMAYYPCVCVTAGPERIEYNPGRMKERYLDINIRIFVNCSDPLQALEAIISDVETLLEENSQLSFTDRYGDTRHITDLTFTEIKTDEGVLAPLGIGEISLTVTYIQ